MPPPGEGVSMKVIIMGCGRVGSELAKTLDLEGHQVSIMDINAHQFTRFLPETFGGRKITGNGIEVARRQPNGEWLLIIDSPYGAD